MFNNKEKMHRKPVLLGKQLQEDREENVREKEIPLQKRSKIITVASTHKGAGCTHVALTVAHSLSKKYKVALVERDPCAELKGFEQMYKLNKGKLNSKKLNKLDVYFFESNELIDIIKEQYDYVFLDIGALITQEEQGLTVRDDITEVYRADVKVLVTQTAEWKLEYLADFIKYNKGIKGWVILANLSNDKNYKELKNTLKSVQSEVLQIPYIEDIFNCLAIDNVLKFIR